MRKIVPCTLRLEEQTYLRVKQFARDRRMSVTAFIEGVLADVLKMEEQKSLYQAFSQAGDDHESADVEFAASAQREAVERQE